MNSICLHGKIVPADKPVWMVDNKSYRYGHGLFETMKIIRKSICLESYHFERFFSGMRLMGFEIPALLTAQKLKQEILMLCEKNKCDALARVRLSAFSGNGGINDRTNNMQYVIECWPLDESVNHLNENGFVTDVFPDACKSCDKFSNIKSASSLPYVMAAQYANENKLNDCFVLNMYDRVADGSIANIFLIKDEKLITPALNEGCINGVMRRWLIQKHKAVETSLSVEDLLSADELFLTNAIYGIRWVKQFRNKSYGNFKSSKIHEALVREVW